MPTFDTREPITASVDVVTGDVRLTAGDVATTVVEVRPSDPANPDDVRAAEGTRVEFAGGTLVVKAPRFRSWAPRTNSGSIDVTIDLPAGSHLKATGAMADFDADGRFGDTRIKTGVGKVALGSVAKLNVRNGAGDIEVDRVTGHAEITSGIGEVRVRALDGSAVIKNSSGPTWVGEAGGDLRVNAASGSIAVDVAQASLVAKASIGDVRVGSLVRGTAVLETRAGDVEIGIREGTAAWLDVHASTGRVENALDAADAPAPADEKVEVRARTTIGNVAIRRAA
ncbi:MAG TPA: DUF4097 family beta strand repeat-containing protein [Solirubrobacter sp.]|nr:DUF4097 family beta strand repeat-containing protein [Solirubrobacter sp.]